MRAEGRGGQRKDGGHSPGWQGIVSRNNAGQRKRTSRARVSGNIQSYGHVSEKGRRGEGLERLAPQDSIQTTRRARLSQDARKSRSPATQSREVVATPPRPSSAARPSLARPPSQPYLGNRGRHTFWRWRLNVQRLHRPHPSRSQQQALFTDAAASRPLPPPRPLTCERTVAHDGPHTAVNHAPEAPPKGPKLLLHPPHVCQVHRLHLAPILSRKGADEAAR